MTEFPHLFSPGSIGNLILKNRLVMSPMQTGFADRRGQVTPLLLEHYRERAKGEVGLVLCEFSYIDDKYSSAGYNQLGAFDDGCISGLGRLAQTIKDHGARVGLQLAHVGQQRSMVGSPAVAPSLVTWDRYGQPTSSPAMELSVGEIEEIIEAFGQAARRVRQAGFDLIEIHGGHGYLITQFLSPLNNLRTDRYGGELESRMLFLRQVFQQVRAGVGPDFPISVRLSQSEFVEGGLTLDDTIEVAQALETAGVDAIHISAGVARSNEWMIAPLYQEPGVNVDAAQAIKQAVSVPVIVVGSITTPYQAETVIADGKADYVTLGRALLADPHFARKAKGGRADEIRPCIRYNDGCQTRRLNLGSIRCSVNVVLGRQDEFSEDIEPSRQPGQKVVVVGGGPGGLEAALVASARKHHVVLFEQCEQLGGWLRTASIPDFKVDLRWYQDYLVGQLHRAGVEVRREQATVVTIAAERPHLVIVATGSRPAKPQLPGADGPNVILATDVFGVAPRADRVVVAGDDQLLDEAALFLVQQGATVHRLQTGREPAWKLDPANRVLTRRLLEAGVTLHTVKQLEAVSPSALTAVDAEGQIHKFHGDRLVIWPGLEPVTGLAEELQARGIPATAVGDCVRPRRILDAVHEGHVAARII